MTPLLSLYLGRTATTGTPSITLNTPSDTGTASSTTPTLDFTGVTSTGDQNISYEIQVDTANTFDSQLATPSVVQRPTGADNNGVSGSVSATFGSNNTAGNTIIVCIPVALTSNSGITTPTDTQGNVYTQIGDFTDGTHFVGQRWFIANNIKAGANTVSCNPDPGATNLHVWEVSGLAASSTLDKSHSTIAATGTALSSGASAATTVANELVLGVFCVDANDTYTAGGSYTNGTTVANTGFSSFGEELIVSSTGAQTATATASSSVVNLSVVMTFKAAGSPLIDALSAVNAGFADITHGGDTDPFPSGDQIGYTVQSALSNGTTYYWRAKQIIPQNNVNYFSGWSSTFSFTVSTSITKTQSAIARVAVNKTKTQSAISRIAVNKTKTQSAIARITQGSNKTQPATARIYQDTFTWSGYVWQLREWTGSPMYNGQWGRGNVIIDSNGYLELSVTNPSGSSPFAAEVDSNTVGWGYGTYQLTIGSRIDNIPSAGVWGGMFTYDGNTLTGDASVSNNEIDTDETSDWGTPANFSSDHGYFWNNAGVKTEIADFFAPTTDAVTTTYLIWLPGKLVITTYVGSDNTGTVIKQSVITTHVPVPALEQVMMNVWVSNAGTTNPATIAPFTVILRSFTFSAAATKTKTQPAIARIATNKTKTQTATARIVQGGTKSQSAIARVANIVTKTQTAKATITGIVTKTQPALARIANVKTKAQSAIARVANAITKTQSATTRVANNAAKTQAAIAHITTTVTKTQSATARIARVVTKTQGATAHVVDNVAGSKTQPAVSRIATNLTVLQTAIGRIATSRTKTQTAVARIAQNRTKTQAAVARIQQTVTKTQTAAGRIANIVTKAQSAVAKIVQSVAGSKTQSAVARIATNPTKAQTAIARISNTKTKTQPAIGRIAQKLSLTQPAIARIATTISKLQSATSRIIAVRTKTQTAVASIQQAVTKTQPAVSRVSKTIAKTQTAIAKVIQSISGSKTQPAVARMANNLTKTQPSIGRIALKRALTQSAIARIAYSLTMIQPAKAHLSNTLTKLQGAAARIATKQTLAQPTVARIAISNSKTQPAIGRIANDRSLAQPAKASMTLFSTGYTLQLAKARIAGRQTFPQSATAYVLGKLPPWYQKHPDSYAAPADSAWQHRQPRQFMSEHPAEWYNSSRKGFSAPK